MLTSIIGLSSVILPPAVKLIKDIFGKKPKDAEETLGVLASEKPEFLSAYVDAQAKLMDAKASFMRADINEKVHSWIMDLRASVRPIITYLLVLNIIVSKCFGWDISLIEANAAGIVIGWWFGERLLTKL